MRYKLQSHEMDFVKRFKAMKYPPIYKLDNTANILFVESVDFDVCKYLLRGKNVSEDNYQTIMEEYEEYLSTIDIQAFDEYAFEHYKLLTQVMEIFKKYCREYSHEWLGGMHEKN